MYTWNRKKKNKSETQTTLKRRRRRRNYRDNKTKNQNERKNKTKNWDNIERSCGCGVVLGAVLHVRNIKRVKLLVFLPIFSPS